MKTQLYLFLVGLAFFATACDEIGPDSLEEGYSIPPAETAISSQIEDHGLDILFAYYCLDLVADKGHLDQALGIATGFDVFYQLHGQDSEKTASRLMGHIVHELDGLSRSEIVRIRQQASDWLNISRVVDSGFCGISEEDYFALLASRSEFKQIFSQRIDPEKGQSVMSLASAQVDEIRIEVWNTLSAMAPPKRAQTIGEIMLACAQADNP